MALSQAVIATGRVFIAAQGQNIGFGTVTRRLPRGYRDFDILVALEDGRRVLTNECNIFSADRVALFAPAQCGSA